MKNSGFSYDVILADGDFPSHTIPLGILENAARIICCDGATGSLDRAGFEPFAIVGDCDSIDKALIEKYQNRIFRIEEQETNDLTKAVKWCVDRGILELTILGATGKREDHTLGNISLLADYSKMAKVQMVSDFGIFYPVPAGETFKSVTGQKVSIFSIDPETEITSKGLKYPLLRMKLKNWWMATLNEAMGESFSLEFENGALIVFIAFDV